MNFTTTTFTTQSAFTQPLPLVQPKAVEQWCLLSALIVVVFWLVWNRHQMYVYVHRKQRTQRAIVQLRQIIALERMLRLPSNKY